MECPRESNPRRQEFHGQEFHNKLVSRMGSIFQSSRHIHAWGHIHTSGPSHNTWKARRRETQWWAEETKTYSRILGSNRCDCRSVLLLRSHDD